VFLAVFRSKSRLVHILALSGVWSMMATYSPLSMAARRLMTVDTTCPATAQSTAPRNTPWAYWARVSCTGCTKVAAFAPDR
jgi:hypothetical protein